MKNGVDEAVAQLRRIEDIKDALGEELVLRISSAAIEEAARKIQLLRDSGQITREEAHAGYALILEAFEWAELQKLEIERRMYNIRRQIAAQEVRDIIGEATGRDSTTDFAAIINALSELQRKYIDDLEIADSIEAEIARNMLERNRKLADMRAESLQEEIAAIERRVEISRRSDGIGFGNSVFEHDLESEREAQREIIALIETQIEFYREMGSARTDYESLMLERLLELHRAYHRQLENLEIDLTRQRSDALRAEHQEIKQLVVESAREYFDARKQIQIEALDAELQRFRDAQDERRRALRRSFDDEITALRSQRSLVTAEFDQRINAIRTAAAAEIEEHRRRISEIDELLRAQSREERDERDLRRIAIIEDALRFERDEMNIFQLNRELERALADFNSRREREALQDERQELNDKISAVRQTANEEIAILRESSAEANRLAQEQAQLRIAELQRSRDEARRVLDDETHEGVRHFQQRRSDIEEFYRDKYNMAVENANDEKMLMMRTQQQMYQFLVSAEVRENYRRAGAAHGHAYRDIFMRYLDEVANRLAQLAAAASRAGAGVGMTPLSFGLLEGARGAAAFAAQSAGITPMSYAQSVDSRTATINQTFNVTGGDVSHYAVKRAATQSLRMVLG
ncbi:MAG: hypothetical protein FWE20_10390 [Defluviitaleaceae bacterium]|nr:hypothetical protein [Defluviitaleaceae bacterium]